MHPLWQWLGSTVSDCQAIYSKYHQVLTLFGHCHNIYDSNQVGDRLPELGKFVLFGLTITANLHILPHFIPAEAIATFMCFYRQAFPDASITVKLHLMEDHMVDFTRRWSGVGFGLMGEQGAESIHASFNEIKRRYTAMPQRVDRLRCILKDHQLRCSPANIMAKPVKKRRRVHVEE